MKLPFRVTGTPATMEALSLVLAILVVALAPLDSPMTTAKPHSLAKVAMHVRMVVLPEDRAIIVFAIAPVGSLVPIVKLDSLAQVDTHATTEALSPAAAIHVDAIVVP